MERFSFLGEPFITNFLNELSLTILRIIKRNPNIYTSYIWKKIIKFGMLKHNSQLYRYINILEQYNLIIINSWKKSAEGIGYSYIITDSGTDVLDFLSKYFE